MTRRARFDQLPDELKSEIGKLWRSRRFSLDDLVGKIRELGEDVSRSGLHRGLQRYEQVSERYRRAQDFAAHIMEKLGAKPDSDIGRLVSELIKTQAFDLLAKLAEAGDDGQLLDPEGLMMLGRMVRDVSTADRTSIETRKKIRDQVAREAEAAVTAVAKEEGLSEATIAAFKRKFLGLQK